MITLCILLLNINYFTKKCTHIYSTNYIANAPTCYSANASYLVSIHSVLMKL